MSGQGARFFPAPANLPEGVVERGLWIGSCPGTVGTLAHVYDLKHYCQRCEEVMSRAWGDSCPICHQSIEKVFV